MHSGTGVACNIGTGVTLPPVTEMEQVQRSRRYRISDAKGVGASRHNARVADHIWTCEEIAALLDQVAILESPMSYTVRPEVAGRFGPGTALDTSVHPPRVESLHYVFEGWLGDDLIESFPCFLASERLAVAIDQAGLTGAEWGEVTVTTDEQFRLFYPELAGALPTWRWFRPSDDDVRADFWLDANAGLHVSEAGLRLLRDFVVDHASIQQDSN